MTCAVPPGHLLARGAARLLREHDVMTVPEFCPAPGLRVDLMGIGPRGDLWVIECKSSRADFRTDHKWQGYLDWCDRFFWSVGPEFPADLLPEDTGLIVGDGFGAEILRFGPETRLPAARRKALTARLARHAAARLQWLSDPPPGAV